MIVQMLFVVYYVKPEFFDDLVAYSFEWQIID